MSNAWKEADDELLRQLVVTHNKQWSVIAEFFPSKTPSQVASRWDKYLDPNLIKGAFTEEEDNLIRQFVAVHGPRCWQQVTEFVPMRSAKQCRERWFNHLDPTVVNKDWTPEEDRIIFEKHQQVGSKWALISRTLPGRTDNAIKNRWNASISKRVKIDDKGNEYLAPDTSKRKRRVARQLPSRPPPIRTVTPPPVIEEKGSSPIGDAEQMKEAFPNAGGDIEIPNGEEMTPINIFSPSLIQTLSISPLKVSPTQFISPISPSAVFSPNFSFMISPSLKTSPADDFDIGYMEEGDGMWAQPSCID